MLTRSSVPCEGVTRGLSYFPAAADHLPSLALGKGHLQLPLHLPGPGTTAYLSIRRTFPRFLDWFGGEEFSTAVRQVAPPPQAPPFLSLRQTISSTSLTDCQAYSSSVLPIKFHCSGGKRLREIEERVPGPPQGGQMAGAQERRKRKTPPPLTGAALSLARAGRCRYPPG